MNSETITDEPMHKAEEGSNFASSTPGFSGPEFPFFIQASFIPPGIPETHVIREMHDSRAYTDDALNGYWDINIWHAHDDHIPIGRAAFVSTAHGVLCDRLAVEHEYHGRGLGRQLLDMGKRLWGSAVQDTESFTDLAEDFWCSFSHEGPVGGRNEA